MRVRTSIRGRMSSVLTTAVPALMVITLVPLAITTSAAAPRGPHPAVPRAAPVQLRAVPAAHVARPTMPPFRPSVAWPAAGSATVDLGAVRVPAGSGGDPAAAWATSAPLTPAGSLPVWVGPAAASATAPSRVAVSVLPRTVAADAGVAGDVVSLRRADGGGAGAPVTVRLGYASFARAYGGDFGSRLRLVTLPPCALTTPTLPACRVRTPVASTNNAVAGTVTATVTLDGAGTPGVVMALDSSGSGGGGDFTGTPAEGVGLLVGGRVVGGVHLRLPDRCRSRTRQPASGPGVVLQLGGGRRRHVRDEQPAVVGG